MLKAVKDLVTSNHDLNRGNHRVKFSTEHEHLIASYWYHSTIICSVDYNIRTFKTNDGGYDTQSTNRAISDYRTYFQNLGYTESFDDLKDMCDYLVSAPFNQSIVVMYSKIDEPHRIIFSKDNNTVGEKIAVVHFETEDNGELESFPFKGPQSLRKELVKLFKFYLDENFNG